MQLAQLALAMEASNNVHIWNELIHMYPESFKAIEMLFLGLYCTYERPRLYPVYIKKYSSKTMY